MHFQGDESIVHGEAIVVNGEVEHVAAESDAAVDHDVRVERIRRCDCWHTDSIAVGAGVRLIALGPHSALQLRPVANAPAEGDEMPALHIG